MEELDKVLNFVQNDQFYSTFQAKVSYLRCSIAGSQYFSNGNKRMGIAIHLFMLTENEAGLKSMDENGFKKLLFDTFPLHN